MTDASQRLASELFWNEVGLPPAEHVLEEAARRLLAGMTIEALRAEFRALPEALVRQEAARLAHRWPHGWPVDYVVRPPAGDKAQRLLVVGPGLSLAGALPVWPDHYIVKPGDTLLALGTGPRIPYLPTELRAWASAAADVVCFLLARLNLERREAVFIGESASAGSALVAAGAFGSGTVLAAAPAVHLGHWATILMTGLSEEPVSGPVFRRNYDRMQLGVNQEFEAQMDAVIPDLLSSAGGPLDITLYVADTDLVLGDSLDLVEMARAWPSVAVERVVGEYAEHNDLGPPFRAFVAERLQLEVRAIP